MPLSARFALFRRRGCADGCLPSGQANPKPEALIAWSALSSGRWRFRLGSGRFSWCRLACAQPTARGARPVTALASAVLFERGIVVVAVLATIAEGLFAVITATDRARTTHRVLDRRVLHSASAEAAAKSPAQTVHNLGGSAKGAAWPHRNHTAARRAHGARQRPAIGHRLRAWHLLTCRCEFRSGARRWFARMSGFGGEAEMLQTGPIRRL
jgi:hypothetical protein